MSGNFSMVKVTSIVPQNKFTNADEEEFFMTRTGGLKRKRSAQHIQPPKKVRAARDKGLKHEPA